MASYTVAKDRTITHDEKVYGPGQTIELTDEQAQKLTHALADGPKPAVDPNVDGDLEAALDSIRRRPDNPDRPVDVEGEEQFKASHKGALNTPPAKPPTDDGKNKTPDTGKGKGDK